MATTFDRLMGSTDNITNAKQVDVATAANQKKSEFTGKPLFGFPEPVKGTLAYQQGEEAIQLANNDARNPFTSAQMSAMQRNSTRKAQPANILSKDMAYLLQAGRAGSIGDNAFEHGSLADDFMKLPAHEILAKYGNEQGMELLNARANAVDQVFLDKTQQRSFMEGATDTGIDIASGLTGSIGGIAALGLGLVNDEAGTYASNKVQELADWFHTGQSDALNARRKVAGAQQALSGMENKQKYTDAVKAGNNKTIAKLARFGSDIADSIGIATKDSMTFQSGVADAMGSLLAAGPVSKGLKVAGSALIPAATTKAAQLAAAIDTAAGVNSVARTAVTAAQHVPTMAAIGLMEGGGAYSQVVNEIMGMDYEQLAKTSPLYNEKIAAGMSPKDARIATASETGKKAAAIQGPIAAATGALVSKFESNPFAKFTPRQAMGNMGREAIEEGIQSGSGQVAQNYAIQQNVDKNKDILDGVGEQAGTGALYGSMSAGVTQAPALVKGTANVAKALVAPTARATVSAVGKAGSAIKDSVLARAETVNQRNEQASPIADTVMQQASQEMQATAEADTNTIKTMVDESTFAPEVKEQINRYADELINSTRFDPESLSQEDVSPLVREAVKGTTDKVSAIQKLADVVNTADQAKDPQGYMDAAVHLYDMLMDFNDITNRDPEAFDNIPADHPAREIVDKYMGFAANIGNSPKVTRAIRAISNMMQQQAAPVTEENINTPEGKLSVQQTALAAEVAPETVDPKAAEIILHHADEGRIALSDRKRTALQTAATLVRNAQAYDAEAERLGLRKQDIVSKQIKTDDSRSGEGQYSALQHAQRIRSAYNAGNFNLATAYLNDFMQFAQHMQNKVGALNTHLATGNGDKNKSIHYDALTQNREWVRSRSPLGVDPRKKKSVEFAQQIGLEAKTVAEIANALASAFPELNVEHIQPTLLDSQLNKPASEVVRNFSKPKAEPVGTGNTYSQTEPVSFNRVSAESLNTPASTETNKEAPVKFTRKSASELIEDTVTNATEAQSDVSTDNKPVAEETTKPTPVDKEEVTQETKPKPPKTTKPVVEEQPKTKAKPEPVVDNKDDVSTSATEERSSPVPKDTHPVDKKGGKLLKPTGNTFTDDLIPSAIWERLDEYEAEYDRIFSNNLDEDFTAKAITIGEVLDIIANSNDGSIEVSERKLAAELLSNLDKNRLKDEIVWGTTEHNLAGTYSYDAGTNTSTIYLNKENGGYTLHALMHEILHAATTVIMSESKSSALRSEIADFQNYVLQFAQDNNIDTKKDNIEYGLSDPVEFVTEVLTNASLQTLLKTIPYKGETVYTRFTKWLRKLFKLSNSTQSAFDKALDITSRTLDYRIKKKDSAKKKNAMELAFPYLSENNYFTKSFDLPVEPTSRLTGQENPLKDISNALRSHGSLESYVGKEISSAYAGAVIGRYEDLLKDGDLIKEKLNERVQEFIKSKELTDISEASRWANGKLLNLVEHVDGQYVLNDSLTEAAILAALQWKLTATNNAGVKDEKDAARITGIDESLLPAGIVDVLNASMTTVEVVSSLAQKIENYWGLKRKPGSYLGYTKGIPTAIAAELLDILVDIGYVESDKLHIDADSEGTPKDINLYRVTPIDSKDPILTYPSAIEEAVLLEPVDKLFLNGELPPVAKTQLRNAAVDNTPEQRAALKNEQATPFYLHTPMVQFYEAMGRNGILELMGAGTIDETKFNKNHAKSLAGQNLSISAAYDQFTSLVGQVRAIDGDITKTPIHYAYNMTRVGRMQMLGKYNPQSSKLMREAVLPTQSTLDLSNQNSLDYSRFSLGLAQALGIKVHNMSREAAQDKLDTLLNGQLAPAVEALKEFQITGSLPSGITDTLKTSLGGDKSFVAIQALMEYARYLNADEAGKKAFTSPLYVEADGVTNGPINAMQLMTGGKFTQRWLRNIAKGGLFFTNRTMNEHRSLHDGVDLYEASTNALKEQLAELAKYVESDPAMKNQMNHLTSLMDLFLPDLNFNEKGELVLKRGIAKNPLTITIYGSGAKGIAGKVVSNVIDVIYERMSDALSSNAPSAAMALFGKQASSEEHAEELLNRFMSDMQALTEMAPVKRRGNLVLEVTGSSHAASTEDINPQTYTLSKEQIEALRDNMLHLFITPMKAGINKTIGQELVNSTEMLQKATQIQSVVLQDMFNQAVERKLKEKENDPSWKKADFLTDHELKDILKSLDKYAPFIKTGEQTFYIAGSESTEIGKGQDVARSLSENVRVPLTVYGPSQAGVAGIPFMTIGTGDGMMMQELATMKNAPQGTLKIFDGMHMKLDSIEEDSVKANQAVYRSWQGNPIKNVWESFNEFLGEVDFSKLSEKARKDITKAFRPVVKYKNGLMPLSTMKEASEWLNNMLRNNAASIDVRHKVLSKVNLTVDQMAAVGSPYRHEGGINLSNLTESELVDKLNEMYEQEIADRREAELDKNRETLSLGSIMDSLSGPLQQVVGEVIASKAASDYVITVDPSITTEGMTEPSKKTITLKSKDDSVLAHELVHAATFETVLDYYNGKSTNPTVNAAIKRIEGLMNQWANLPDKLPTDAIIEYHINEAAAFKTAENKAIALNEFMAYVLTNKKSIAKAKATPALVRIGKDVLKLIKRMFSAMGFKAIAKDDMFSNLLFNTAIIMHSQPATSAVSNDTVLFHNAAYGNNARLTELGKTFQAIIGDYLTKSPIDGPSKVKADLINTVKLTRMVQGHGFPMTMQERGVFESVVTSMATAAAIDPNALSRAQELFSHVTKNLTVEHFMRDPKGNDPADRYYAQEKFDVLMGNFGVEKDTYGRSSLLPVFVGLAMVNDEVRNVLKSIEVPKADKKLGHDLDDLLSNAGVWSMQKLNSYLAGDHKAVNVQEAMDALTATIADTAQQKEGFYDAVATPSGRFVDRANDYVVKGIERLSDAAIAKADAVRATSTNKYARAGAEFTRLLSAIATEKNGQIVSQGVMHAMNQGKVWQPFHDLVNDIVGRTDTNANVYDMIKPVRSQIQQDRQQFREHLPTVIAEKFSRKLTEEEWSSLHMGMGKTDLAVLRDTMSMDEISELFTDKNALAKSITDLEGVLSKQDTKNWSLVQSKAKQLAAFMTGDIAGSHLLRNAEAIANLVGLSKKGSTIDVAQLDKLITLYALDNMPKSTKVDMEKLMRTERNGTDFSMAYMMGQRVEEKRKAQLNSAARFNSYKGYIPTENQQGVNLIVAEDSEYASLAQKSYVRVAAYNGSKHDRNRKSRSYYFSPVSARAPFSQGILQNVRESVNGVDAHTGFTLGSGVVNRITDPTTVGRITKSLISRTDTSREPLLPVFNANGDIIAYELAADPHQLARLNQDTHFGKMVGIWRGRQVEEAKAQKFNDALVSELHKMYLNDLKNGSSTKSQYINILDPVEQKKDPVLADAVKLINKETLNKAEGLFGKDELWVRRDMLNDAFGYRVASVGDMWTGNTRYSKATTDAIRSVFISAMGNNAYRRLVNAENTIKHVVSDAKTIIVIKSLVVPAVNFLANLYQMVGRGVPVKDIAKGVAHKTNEINQYVKTRLRQIDAEAELRAAQGNPNLERKLKTEIQSIVDSHKRLSIWPLIEAGEFSSISDAGISRDDVLIPDGKMYEYMTNLVSKLPEPVRNAGRYALITKDTALFQGIQKTVEYSDFVAKAIIYDDLTKRKGKSSKEAMGRVTEEFVNYDRLPGRFRSYMESMGLMWFYNFKIRSVKVAMSMIRNNPVHSLISTLVPAPTMFGNVGLPIEDNMFSALVDGRLDSSIGIGQGLRAPSLNPWHNLIN